MKKEDLCMLLLVVALLLVVSRNTNIFEGIDETLGVPDLGSILGGDNVQEEVIDEAVEVPAPAPLPVNKDIVTREVPPVQPGETPPTPPTPAIPPTPPAAPPAPKPAPPAPKPAPPAPKPSPPAPKQAPPAPKPTPPAPKPTPPAPKPTPPIAATEESPFGAPLTDQKGAFGEGWVNAFDISSDVYASTGKDDVYGEKIPLSMQQEYLTMKSFGTLTPQIMQNLGEQRSQGEVLGTDFKPWDPSSTSGALLDTQFEGVQITKGTPSKTVTFDSQLTAGPSGNPIEVHMVYGEWCGHSRNAKPEFEKLVSNNSVSTSSGSPVKFVMTTDDSDGMEKFKGVVTGFPTYMVVKSDGSLEELNNKGRSESDIKDAVQKLNY